MASCEPCESENEQVSCVRNRKLTRQLQIMTSRCPMHCHQRLRVSPPSSPDKLHAIHTILSDLLTVLTYYTQTTYSASHQLRLDFRTHSNCLEDSAKVIFSKDDWIKRNCDPTPGCMYPHGTIVCTSYSGRACTPSHEGEGPLSCVMGVRLLIYLPRAPSAINALQYTSQHENITNIHNATTTFL